MDVFVNDITLSFLNWFFVSLVAFLLGLFLGYWLWYKYKSQVSIAEADLQAEHRRYLELEMKYSELKYKHEKQETALTEARSALNNCEGDRAVLRGMLADYKSKQKEEASTGVVSTPSLEESADDSTHSRPKIHDDISEAEDRAVYARLFNTDDLQIIEGIGPKIEALLNNSGIHTWSELGGAEVNRLKAILDNAGPRYRMHDPGRWAHQAALADAGKWDELITYQKSEDPQGKPTPSKLEKLTAKKLGFSSNNPEDLKVIEGIGPKIEGLLKSAGIHNWSDLASSDVSKLQSILDDAGDRFKLAAPKTWPKQAELAVKGQWSRLTEYQEFLQGGKEPS